MSFKKIKWDPRLELYVPITVLRESVIECLLEEKKGDGEHDLSELYRLIEL